MPWNQPGNRGNQQNPWNDKSNGQGPPDLGEVFKKFSTFFGGNKSNDSNFGVLLIISIVVAAILYIVFVAAYIVDEKEKAIILRFGRYVETVGSGLHFHFPPIDKKYQRNTTEVQTYRHSAPMLTKDENIVFVDISVQYFIKDLKDYVLNVQAPENTLKHASESALRHIIGISEMDWVLKDRRDLISTDVENRLQSYLDNYKSGLQVSTVNIEDSHPPQEVKEAFDDVFKAREDYVRLQNEAKAYSTVVTNDAEATAIRAIAEAKAYKAEVTQSSIGEADRFSKLLTEYQKAPKVTRERLYIESIQSALTKSSKIIVDTSNGNNLLYLPLDKLMSSQKTGGNQPAQTTIDIDKLTNEVLKRLQESDSRTQERR